MRGRTRRLAPDVILAQGVVSAALRQETRTIPIVFVPSPIRSERLGGQPRAPRPQRDRIYASRIMLERQIG